MVEVQPLSCCLAVVRPPNKLSSCRCFAALLPPPSRTRAGFLGRRLSRLATLNPLSSSRGIPISACWCCFCCCCRCRFLALAHRSYGVCTSILSCYCFRGRALWWRSCDRRCTPMQLRGCNDVRTRAGGGDDSLSLGSLVEAPFLREKGACSFKNTSSRRADP